MTSLALTAELGAEAETEAKAVPAVSRGRRLTRLRRLLMVAAGPWAILVSAYLFSTFVLPRWAHAAPQAADHQLAFASMPLGVVDTEQYNVLVMVIITNVVLGVGQAGDVILRFREKLLKQDEGSFRAKCAMQEEIIKKLQADLDNKTENHQKEIERRQKDFNDRLQQQIASAALNTKDYESRIKQLQENIVWLNDQMIRLREGSERAHELLAMQAKGATSPVVETKVEVHGMDKAQVSTTTEPAP